MTLAVRKMLNLLATQGAGGERNWAPRQQQMAQPSMGRIGNSPAPWWVCNVADHLGKHRGTN